MDNSKIMVYFKDINVSAQNNKAKENIFENLDKAINAINNSNNREMKFYINKFKKEISK